MRKGKSPDHIPKKNITFSVKSAFTESIISLGSIIIGSYFVYDFFIRLAHGEKVFCSDYEPPCIGEELLYGVPLLIGGILGFVHIYYMFKLSKNA